MFDCNEALKFRSNEVDALDTRALVFLKLGKLDQAIADYDAALKLNPAFARSLYGRGVARLKKGDANGTEDINSAVNSNANIVEEFFGARSEGKSRRANSLD